MSAERFDPEGSSSLRHQGRAPANADMSLSSHLRYLSTWLSQEKPGSFRLHSAATFALFATPKSTCGRLGGHNDTSLRQSRFMDVEDIAYFPPSIFSASPCLHLPAGSLLVRAGSGYPMRQDHPVYYTPQHTVLPYDQRRCILDGTHDSFPTAKDDTARSNGLVQPFRLVVTPIRIYVVGQAGK